MLLQNRIDSRLNLVLAAEDSDMVDGFSCLGICISPGDRIYYKLFSLTEKSVLAFTSLRHLRRRRDIRLSIKVFLCAIMVKLVIPCDSETWLLVVDLRRLSPFGHRCLRSTRRLYWEDFVSNSEVRRKVPSPKVQSLKQALNQSRLGRLRDV